MSSLAIAGLVFACIFAAALLTMFLGVGQPLSERPDVVGQPWRPAGERE